MLSARELRDDAFTPPPSVVFLSHRLWRDRFGGDPGVVGRTIHLNGTPYTVVGVSPRGFRVVLPPDVGLASDVDAWTPLRIPPALFRRAEGRWQDQDSDNTGAIIGRMAAGATLRDVRAEMDVLAARQRRTIPTYRTEGVRIEAEPMRADVVSRSRPALLFLLAAVLLVLLVASLNVAGLLLARNLDRSGELRIKRALGAGRPRLLGEELLHGLVVSGLGALAGVALAAWGVRVLPAIAPGGIPLLSGSALDARVLGFALSATLGVALVSGFLPGAAALRSSATGPARGGSARSTRGGGRSSRLLVAGQVAITTVLLVGSGLLLRTFVHLQQVRPGFEPRGLATFRISLPPGRFGGPSDRAAFLERYADRLRAGRGVRAVGIVGGLPLGGELWTRPYGPGGSPPADWGHREANFRVIDSGYFRALGTRVLAGRTFTRREDRVEGDRVAVVDATLARRVSRDGTIRGALGAHLGFPLDGRAVEAEIVGIVEPVLYASLQAEPRPTIYVPYRQEASRTVGLAVRTDGSAADVEAAARRELERLHVASTVPVFDFRPMQAYVARAAAPLRFALVLVAAFALLALFLASVGIYGTASYAVRRGRREIGIRMAVGASPGGVLRLFARRGIGPVLAGLAGGLAVGAGASRVVGAASALASPVDARLLGTVAGVMFLAGARASLLPARAAARVEPSRVLR
ncbi:MAG TPA: ABC transporter permease, partial [Gemmatimonadota bacterium]|nr:ABC transporter permease [Gemmatimonadota bacterium]